MRTKRNRQRLLVSVALAATLALPTGCVVSHGHGSYCSDSYWYEDVGIALLAVGVFIIAACSGGHGSFHGHYGHGYHSGWHHR